MMRILWITNILFPEAVSLITGKAELKASGGWMLGAAKALIESDELTSFSVATVSPLVKSLTVLQGKDITYYVIPRGNGNLKYNKEYEPYWRQINDQIQPDVIHIHGTEFTHGLAYVRACGNERVVVSVQGLKSGIAPYYCAGLTWRDIYGNLIIRDIFKGNIYKEQREFYRTGELEKELLKKVLHIIGRTSWDKARVWAINPTAKYHFCNETLREEFYQGDSWSYETCVPYTIFLSQGSYPLKGLHQVLKAMPLILRHFPDTQVRIAGSDITNTKGLRNYLRLNGYGRIIKSLIKKYKLSGHVSFTGSLNAEEMKQEYLRCNVFVCPSSIENSPNSLGEAQLLGVPCVAAYVGGVPDMMRNYEKYMYRFEEIEMLAFNVIDIFNTSKNLGDVGMSTTASIRHDAILNTNQLLAIYNEIITE